MTQIEKNNKAEALKRLEGLYLDVRDEISGKEVGARDRNAEEQRREQEERQYVQGNRGNLPTRGQDFHEHEAQLAEDEEEKLRHWQEFDKKLDGKLDDMNILLDQIKTQAVEQGEKMKSNNELTRKVDKEITKTNAQLDTQNNRLKDLVKKYRAPSRFCLDFIILLLIIGLIGIIVNMLR